MFVFGFGKEEEVVEEESLINLFSLYPNPSSDLITIELTELTPDSKIKIIDMNGKVMHEQAVKAREISIDLNHLHKGVYLVFVMSEGNLIEREKLIIH